MSWLMLATLLALFFIMLFSLAEAAAVASDRLSLTIKARDSRRARLLVSMLEPPSILIMTTLIGTDLVLVLGSTFFSRFVALTVDPAYRELVGTFGLTLAFFLFGELIPKSIGISFPNRISLGLVELIRWLSIPLKPLIIMVQGVAKSILALLGMKEHQRSKVINRDEIILMFADTRHSRMVPPTERRMIKSIINFSETKVSEIMVPLVQVTAVAAGKTVREGIAVLGESTGNFLPIYEDRVDKILGIVTVNDMLGASLERNLRELVRVLPVVPEAGYMEYALPVLKDSLDQVAVVVDEFGGASGLIFLDDVFGIILRDENMGQEGKHHETASKAQTDFALPAQTALAEAEELLDTSLPQGPFVTLGGMMVSLMGYFPKIGESLRVGDYEFMVAEATPRVITSLHVRKL